MKRKKHRNPDNKLIDTTHLKHEWQWVRRVCINIKDEEPGFKKGFTDKDRDTAYRIAGIVERVLKDNAEQDRDAHLTIPLEPLQAALMLRKFALHEPIRRDDGKQRRALSKEVARLKEEGYGCP